MTAQTKIEAPANVYAKIAAITGILAQTGIAKNRTANFGKFRGIDDVYNALAPLLAEYRLTVMPRMIARDSVERTSKSGSALFYVTVEAEFDFVSADDGSLHTVRTFGEAMDSSDKATNKAMSAAYKYAAFMTFCIPTEGEADHEMHEVLAREPMPPEAYAKIVQLVEATNTNVPTMFQALGIRATALDALNPADYEKAVSALETKLAKLAKAETDAKAKEAVDA